MEISIKESTMVFPAGDTPKRILEPSNLDLIQIPYHVSTVYFYKPDDGSSNFFDSRALKDALSQILVPFYPVAGRLQYDEDERLEIICNGEGVLFLEAETTSDVINDELIMDFTDNSRVPQLVPTIDYSGGVSSYPLLALQVTRFKCGGVSIGVAFQHTVVDGPSALHFINSWADMVRGLPLKIMPFHDRTLLKARVPPTSKFQHIEFQPSPRLKNSSSTDPKPSHSVSVFKITADQLNTLKSKINGITEQYYTTYCILTAYVWRFAMKARGLPHDQVMKLLIPVDGRQRLDPPIPPGFIGNAIFFTATPVVLVGDLVNESFLDTVRRIHGTLKQINDEYLRSAIDYTEVAGIENVMQGPETMGCPNLSINSWYWLPLHEANFGWGRPAFMRLAKIVHEGKIYVLSSPTDDGSLSVVARLETSALKSFGKLLYEGLA